VNGSQTDLHSLPTINLETLDSVAGDRTIKKERDPDFINAEIALKRAAKKARLRAAQAGVNVIVVQDGRIIAERPDKAV
jgi:hypothetical protein